MCAPREKMVRTEVILYNMVIPIKIYSHSTSNMIAVRILVLLFW